VGRENREGGKNSTSVRKEKEQKRREKKSV